MPVSADPERFALLAAAVAGRRIGVVAGEEERSYTDGDVIYAAAHEDPLLVRGGLVVQASLLAAGSLEGRTLTRLMGRRNLRHRYLTLEAIRAVHELSDAVPRPIARQVRGIYDGPVSASRRESLERVLKGREAIPEAPDWFGTIKPNKVVLNQAQENGVSPQAKDAQRPAAGDERFKDLDDEDESERSRIMDLFTAPAMRNPFSDLVQKILGAGRSPDTDGSAGDEMPVGGSRVGRVGRNAKPADAPPGLVFDLSSPPLGRLYPEWDFRRGRYRPDHCAVAEWDPALGEEEPRVDVGDDRLLRRELARLGLAHQRHRRQHDGDALDLASLIDYVIDRRAGATPDGRVYETKRRTAHDLGVVVLLDATGSTGEADEGLRVFDEQRTVAARITATLDELGNRVACYGFQSWGRDSTRFLRVKGFDDRYDLAAQRRLAALQPSGFTRLGAAVRHATWLLAEKGGTDTTLLILVGDGLPYDDGYEHRYAQEDSRRALEEAVREGVGCACVSVRTSTEQDVIERVWGAVPYRQLEHPSELARHATALFRGALKEAAATRRRVA